MFAITYITGCNTVRPVGGTLVKYTQTGGKIIDADSFYFFRNYVMRPKKVYVSYTVGDSADIELQARYLKGLAEMPHDVIITTLGYQFTDLNTSYEFEFASMDKNDTPYCITFVRPDSVSYKFIFKNFKFNRGDFGIEKDTILMGRKMKMVFTKHFQEGDLYDLYTRPNPDNKFQRKFKRYFPKYKNFCFAGTFFDDFGRSDEVTLLSSKAERNTDLEHILTTWAETSRKTSVNTQPVDAICPLLPIPPPPNNGKKYLYVPY